MDPGETGSYTLQVAMTGICVLFLILSLNQGHQKKLTEKIV